MGDLRTRERGRQARAVQRVPGGVGPKSSSDFPNRFRSDGDPHRTSEE
jgi:hypothetical protein